MTQPFPTFNGDWQRPNLTGDLKRNEGPDFLTSYFANPEVAVIPDLYTIGNAARTLSSVRTPGLNNANLSIFKEIPLSRLREGMRLEFRAEFFNAFNHPRFCGPTGSRLEVGRSNFGKVTAQCNDPREVQMAIKFYW
jgi:hypothetical protein